MSDPASLPSAAEPPVIVPALPRGELDVAKVPLPQPGADVVTVADRVRKWGMYLLLWAFLMTIGLSLALILFSDDPETDKLLRIAKDNRDLAVSLAEKRFDHLKQILQILLPAETALLGSAMGFYYGSQSRSAGG